MTSIEKRDHIVAELEKRGEYGLVVLVKELHQDLARLLVVAECTEAWDLYHFGRITEKELARRLEPHGFQGAHDNPGIWIDRLRCDAIGRAAPRPH